MEVLASRTYNFNMGIKLIRGAYMNEERTLAAEKKLPSPVWDSIEETHLCYNRNLECILRAMHGRDQLFIASHNTESVQLAQDLGEEMGLKHENCVKFGQRKGFSD